MSVFREAIEICRRLGVECFTISLDHLAVMDQSLDRADQSALILDLQAQLADAQKRAEAVASVDADTVRERDSLQERLVIVSNALADKTQQYIGLYAVNQDQANKLDLASARIVELGAEVDTLKLAIPSADASIAGDAKPV